MWTTLLALGIPALIMVHAAYSTIAYRHHLRLAHVEYEGLPVAILGEAVVGFALALAAVFYTMPPLKPVSIVAHHVENTTPSAFHSRVSFISFNHRAKPFASLDQ